MNNINYITFETMFGIKEPLYIEKIETNHQEREMHIRINFRKGTRFECPNCKSKDHPVNNTEYKKLRTLDMHHYKTWLHFRTPYISCSSGKCGTPLWTPPWSNSGSTFLKYFEAFVIELVQSGMPVNEVAKLVGEVYDTKLWRFIIPYVKEEYSKKDYSNVTRMAFDETSRKKGHNYFLITTDLDQRKVINVVPGKDSNAMAAAIKELEALGLDPLKVKEVSIDMSKAFIKGVRENLPNAQITFDKFHIIKPLNEALDAVRKQESVNGDGIKNKRWCLLKNAKNLNASQEIKLQQIKNKYPKLGRAYRMVQVFKDIFSSSNTRASAELETKKWLSWAVRSRLEPIKAFAKTVKAHWEGYMHYFDSHITNGIAEGINSVIQSIKRSARGYRNKDYFRTIIYLRLADLPMPLPQ